MGLEISLESGLLDDGVNLCKYLGMMVKETLREVCAGFADFFHCLA